MGLGPVMVPAQRDQVRLAGRPSRERHPMVEVAPVGRLPTAREGAHLVPGPHMPGQRSRRPIHRGAVIQQRAGHRVDHQPPPGAVRVGGDPPHRLGVDRAEPGHLTRPVIQPEQGARRHHHPHLRPTPPPAAGSTTVGRSRDLAIGRRRATVVRPAWRILAGPPGPAQVHQGVHASGIDRPRVLRCCATCE
jgi:hypothetical protein